MNIFKKLCSVLLTVALLATIASSFFTSVQQNTAGGYSTLSTITERSATWLLQQFGHCQTVPELLDAIDRFGCEHFVYDLQPVFFQAFDLDKFLFEDHFHGVCFDFSCFVKCAVLVWREAKGRTDVQVFVYDVRTRKGGHSYNFITEAGHTWFLCLTSNNTRTSKGKPSLGAIEITGTSPKEYSKSYEEIVYNIH